MTASAVEAWARLEDLLAAEPGDEWFIVWFPPPFHNKLRKRLFGEGSWALLTVEQYYSGKGPDPGWHTDGPWRMPAPWLAQWAEGLLHYPVELLPHTANLCLPQRPHDTFRVPVYLVRRNS